MGTPEDMPTRPISPRAHGVLDYVTGATLVAAPSVLGLDGTRAGRALRAAGATHTGYSVLTKYQLGAVRVLPFRAHLALDGVGAVGLAASPWVFGFSSERRRRRRGVRRRSLGLRAWLPHVALGLYELGTVALTRRTGDPVVEETLASSTPAPASSPDVVMPDGAEANASIGARTIGGSDRPGHGIGSGVGGQQV